jgi:hypothetical protein
MRLRFALALPVALLFAACDTAAPLTSTDAVAREGASLTVDREVYRQGDTAALTLRNAGAARLVTGVLACALVERWDGQGWEPSLDGSDRPCIEIAVVVEPGGRLTGEVPLDVRRGSYRISHSVTPEDGGPSGMVRTAAFQVAG